MVGPYGFRRIEWGRKTVVREAHHLLFPAGRFLVAAPLIFGRGQERPCSIVALTPDVEPTALLRLERCYREEKRRRN